MCLPAGRSAINTRPRSSNAAATTRSRGFAVKLLDSLEHPVAVLELLATAAGTRRVTADFRRRTHGSLCWLHGRLGRGATTGTLRGRRRLLWRLLTRGTQLRERRGFGVLSLQRAIQPLATLFFLAFDLLGALHLHVERREDRDGV